MSTPSNAATNAAHPAIGSVLIVEDDPIISNRIARELRDTGYSIEEVDTARQAELVVRSRPPGVVLLDLSLPDSNDLSLFHKIRGISPRTRVVIMTAMEADELVIEATSGAAYEFISKSSDVMRRVPVTVRNAMVALEQEESLLHLSTLVQQNRFSRLITRAPQMHEVKAAIDKLAVSRVNVLVTGPSGTGKEIVARTIHESGPRSLQPFIAINCAGIPDALLESELFGYERGAFTGAVARKAGRFDAAQGGTLFLDEIGEMSLSLQAKLLRVLQDGRFQRLGGNQEFQATARIICATNRDLPAMVKQGHFREDLYYRISVFPLNLPPLAARKGDIALLVEHFLRLYGREENKDLQAVSPEVMRLFDRHTWPGNVRQLQNVLAHAAVVCVGDTISIRDLPTPFMQELIDLPRELPALEATPPRPFMAVSARQPGTAASISGTYEPQPFSEQALTAAPSATLDEAVVVRLASPDAQVRLDAALELAFPLADDLPTAEDLESAGVRLCLKRLNNNMQMTARRLGISRATLYRRAARPQ